MICGFRIVLGTDGAGLLMKIADGNDGGAAEGFIEMHGAATDDEEGMLHALIGEELNDVV
jgi:hypothetical protein